MNNIPTAEEFALENMQGTDLQEIERALIEFAKLHVQSALEAAAVEKTYGMMVVPLFNDEQQKAILNAYPLTNIK
jgi:hypothetical protein